MELLTKTFKIINPTDNSEQTYMMKEMNGEEDLAYQFQFTNPQTGALNIRDLWIRRLSRTVINPPMSESDLKKLPAWVFNSLIKQWMLMNEAVPAHFLENLTDTKTT